MKNEENNATKTEENTKVDEAPKVEEQNQEINPPKVEETSVKEETEEPKNEG